MSAYLDKAGLSYFWSKLKGYFQGHDDRITALESAGTSTSFTYNGATINFRIIGGTFVEVSVSGTATSLPAGNVSIGTLPAAYRPTSNNIYEAISANSGAATSGGALIQFGINTAGAVTLYNYGSAKSNIWLRHHTVYSCV